MRKLILSVVVCVVIGLCHGVRAETPAQQRMKAAKELQNTFDNSMLKGWGLRFVVRGKDCDVLHVEGHTNLEEEMMESLGYGTAIYGKIQPGGVNKFAFNRGFRDIIYSNSEDSKYVSFGSTKLTRDQVRTLSPCTDQIASQLTGEVVAPPPPTTNQFEQLSWPKANAGTKIYDGSYRHVATIVSIDRAAEIIMVRFEKSGSIEPKKLSAVAPYWYVRK